MPRVMLAIVEGREVGREFSVTQATLIGQGPNADVVIRDSDVAPQHASLVLADDGFVVEDLGSTAGTLVNGSRISAARRLQVGDRIQVGTTVLEVRASPPASAEAEGDVRDRRATRVRQTPRAQPGEPGVSAATRRITRTRLIPTVPVLVFVGGQRNGTEVPVGSQVVVGRDAGAADVILDEDTQVSRRHAAFSPAGAGLTAQDLGSTNGTFVNGARLTGVVALNNGDRIQLGETVIEVRLPGETVVEPAAPPTSAPGATALPPNTIEAEGLVKDFGGKRAVDGVSLFVNPGEIYGFLGPNGAGKSTTVHMLVTLLPPTSGTARVAGFDVTSQGASVRASIGVALQAAALDDHLNAWQHMDLQTSLQGVPRSERKQRAAELLERVGLTDAADRRAGGYSGGMKRRLDLALALVHRPRVLFLDEPTTGLDPHSRTALWEEVARLVKEEGMTVFLTTQYLEEADVMADRVGIIDHGEIVAEDTPAALKGEIGRPTLEVLPLMSGDFAAVSAVLERFGELASATNKGVAVRLRPGVDDLAAVVRALDAEGLRLANVELHAPTLDDVFLIKTGHSLEGASADGEPEQSEVLDQQQARGVPGAGSAPRV
jgi:ABC-2 type transport system ATP-binding protein